MQREKSQSDCLFQKIIEKNQLSLNCSVSKRIIYVVKLKQVSTRNFIFIKYNIYFFNESTCHFRKQPNIVLGQKGDICKKGQFDCTIENTNKLNEKFQELQMNLSNKLEEMNKQFQETITEIQKNISKDINSVRGL